ncbi:MAG: PaaI family thioesterase [Firmicutes bacterium]|nr:PaaI family thioesterase [Bacillota bacterium]
MRSWTDKDAEAQMRLVLEKMKKAPEGSIEHLIEREFLACSVEEHWMDFTIKVPVLSENRIGVANGGYLAAITDEGMGCAFSALNGDPDVLPTTLDYQVSTIRPIYPGQAVRMRVTMEHVGKRTALCHAYIYDGDKLCVIATENFAMLKTDKVTPSEWYK